MELYGSSELSFSNYYVLTIQEEYLSNSNIPAEVLCAINIHGIEFFDNLWWESVLSFTNENLGKLVSIYYDENVVGIVFKDDDWSSLFGD